MHLKKHNSALIQHVFLTARLSSSFINLKSEVKHSTFNSVLLRENIHSSCWEMYFSQLQFPSPILNCRPFSHKPSSLTSRLLLAHAEQVHYFPTQFCQKKPKKNASWYQRVPWEQNVTKMRCHPLSSLVRSPPADCHRCCDSVCLCTLRLNTGNKSIKGATLTCCFWEKYSIFWLIVYPLNY